tara:strand:+ start:345 stop:953 length:609 start_codon:yes stop_codon:yes gene_type:complete
MDIVKYDQVMVIDNLFSPEEVEMMDTYFTYFDGWQFIFDDSPDDNLSTFSLGRAIDYPNYGEFDYFCKQHVFPRAGIPIPAFHRVVYNAFRFGDSPSIHCDGEALDAISFLVYCNKEWKPEWGGETIFMNGDRITDTIIPKPGRIVVFPGLVPHGGKAPTKHCPVAARYSAVFQFCPGQEEVVEAHAQGQERNRRPFPYEPK